MTKETSSSSSFQQEVVCDSAQQQNQLEQQQLEVTIVDMNSVMKGYHDDSNTNTNNNKDGTTASRTGSGSENDNTSLSTNTTTADEVVVPSSLRTLPTTFVDCCKLIMSTILFMISVAMVTSAIFTKQTTATAPSTSDGEVEEDNGLSPIIAYIIFWTILIWLAQLEGGLNCVVALQPVSKDIYSKSHTRTYGCTKIAHSGDNVDRFIVGRQYLDLTIVFTTSYMVSTISDVSVLQDYYIPSFFNGLFLSSGLAVTLITIVVGQLISQINSSRYMFDFMNNYLMLLSTYIIFTVEASGLLHAVYLIQILAAKGSGQVLITNEPTPRPMYKKIWFWIRITYSTCFVCFALVVVGQALYQKKTTAWEFCPWYGSIILLIVLTLIAGLMESLQIASMSYAQRSGTDLAIHYPTAKQNYDLLFPNKKEQEEEQQQDNNAEDTTMTAERKSSSSTTTAADIEKNNRFQSFLIGRQIFQTVIMFVFARIVTIRIDETDEMDTATMSLCQYNSTMLSICRTGIFGTILAVVLSSLSWRILACNFPYLFLSCPFSRPIIYLCLYTERTGICYIAWILAAIHEKLGRFKPDTYYINKYNHNNNNKKSVPTTQEQQQDGTSSQQSGCTDDNVDYSA